MICRTWRTSSKELKSHQDGYGPTIAQLSNRVEFRILENKEVQSGLLRYRSHTIIYPSGSKEAVALHLDRTVTQLFSNEAHHDKTDCNSPLDVYGNAGEYHRPTETLGEWLVRSYLPLNPGE